MSKKHKKVCTTLIYINHIFVLHSTVTRIAEIKKYKSIIKKKKKKHNKIVLLAKSKLNNMEVLIFNALIDSVISHDEYVLINNV